MLFRSANQDDVWQLLDSIERKSWAPWLAASSSVIASRIQKFPSGQILAVEGDLIAGYLSLNRIDLDVDGVWPDWHGVVGINEGYENFDTDGNTLFLVSMGVAPYFRGSGLPGRLLLEAKKIASSCGSLKLASCFRPSGFGKYKYEKQEVVQMADYLTLKNKDGLPVDPWLRSLAKNGARFIGVSQEYYSKHIANDEFEVYRNTYNPGFWWNKDGTWECCETGSFIKETVGFRYLESNVKGLLD